MRSLTTDAYLIVTGAGSGCTVVGWVPGTTAFGPGTGCA
jgi:hypothetical protein